MEEAALAQESSDSEDESDSEQARSDLSLIHI